MEYGFYEYICEWFDEDNMKMTNVHGVIFAENFADAAYELTNYYGEDMIDTMQIVALEPGSVYEFENGASTFNFTIEEKD